MSEWTDAKLADLRRLHEAGFSFSHIAAELGFTRSACIGKANRIGLKKIIVKSAPVLKRERVRISDGMVEAIRDCARAGMTQKQTVAELGRRFAGRSVPAVKTVNSMASRLKIPFKGHQVAQERKVIAGKPVLIERMFPVRPTPKQRTGGVTILDLEHGMCRWPIGEVGSPEFRYCGSDAMEGRSYCTTHFRKSCAKHWLEGTKEGRAAARELEHV